MHAKVRVFILPSQFILTFEYKDDEAFFVSVGGLSRDQRISSAGDDRISSTGDDRISQAAS